MNKPLMIIGAGGHAKVVLDAALNAGFTILGLADTDPSRKGEKVLGIPIIDGNSWMEAHSTDSVALVMGIGSIGDTSKRQEIFAQLLAKGFDFATVVHPSAVVAQGVTLGCGTVIMAGAIIQPGCCIEDNVIINTGAQVDHDGHIQAHAHIAPGAILCGDVTVGKGAHIGAGAKIIQAVEVGEASIVAAGAVVTRNAPAHSLLMGLPANVFNKKS